MQAGWRLARFSPNSFDQTDLLCQSRSESLHHNLGLWN